MNSVVDFHQTVLDHLHDGVYVINSEQKIVYWNKAAEKITGYQETEIIDCHCYNELLNPIDKNGVSLCNHDCPAKKTFADGTIRTEEVYLHHKEGYRLPIEIKLTPIFNQETGEITGITKLLADISEKLALTDKLKRLKNKTLRDSLTEIGNREYIQIKLQKKLNELKRYDRQFGILFIDLDNFKQINDTYGHHVGDKVLTMAARTIEKNLRSFDIVGRWGGDEFIVGIINVARKELKATANRLKNLINNSYLNLDQQQITITSSIGGTMAAADDTVSTLINRADHNMYASKTQGKNKIVIN